MLPTQWPLNGDNVRNQEGGGMSRISKIIRRNKRRRGMEKVVIAKCVGVGCGHKREIKAGEITKGEQPVPVCDKCFMPMIAERVELRDEF